LTIAADSRTDMPETGQHLDTECKISAFGSKFVFIMAGMVRKQGYWDAHDVARQVWNEKAKSRTYSASEIVSAVSQEWTKRMEALYASPGLVAGTRRSVTDEPVLAAALFGSTDKTGKLPATAVNIQFDLREFDSSKKVRVRHNMTELHPDIWIAGGHSETAEEYKTQATPKAKAYMESFNKKIQRLPLKAQHSATMKKLIELSILQHPRRNELGFPIDVVQLNKATGIRWIQRKQGCPAY
jgi:hypothetical protein